MLRSVRGPNGLRSKSISSISNPSNNLKSTSFSSIRGYATASTVPKPRRSYTRSVFTTLLVSTVLFYGVSVPLGFYSIRYRDFLVETIPGGEVLADYIDEYELYNGSPASGSKAEGGEGGAGTELTKFAETKARASGWELKPAQVTEARTGGASVSEVAKDRAEAAARKSKADATKLAAQAKALETAVATKALAEATKVKDMVAPAVVSVEEKVKEVAKEVKTLVDEATTMISDAASSVPSAIASATSITQAEPIVSIIDEHAPPAPSTLVTKSTSSRPRELDATPIPRKRANNETYTGPPLPIGFEPPVGYELPRAPPTPKTELKPIPLPPAPLPLVAPSVQNLATSEPMLGQLAATIDSLAKFVANNTDAISSSASTVLKTAESDIRVLGERLESIKREENAKLEESLKKQASDYSGLLLAAEKELVERLDTQEEDWKKAFDDERRTLVEAYKEKLDNELATQQELINLRLKEEVVAQGIELQRRWVREIKVRVEQERGGRLAKLEELEGGIRKLEKVTKETEQIVSEAAKARKVWTAVKAVEHKVATGAAFEDELRALKRLISTQSSESATIVNNLINLALSTVPESVAANGVPSFPALASRFTTSVSPQLRRVALLPENAGLLGYLSSYVMSSFLFTKNGWADGEDVISIIARAEWYLENKDLDGAAKEVNTLVGWPKRLAKDWLIEARKALETEQALKIAEAQATLASLSAL